MVCDLYDRAVATLNTIHINNLIIDDVNKYLYVFSIIIRLTMAVYNSVLSSLMEDEISRGVNNTTSLLLSNVSFTYSVLALSFDTSVYLLINNQFDIVSRLSTFGVTPFDIQRILERFIDKLNQQSSYLVNGDVRAHYNKVLVRMMYDCRFLRQLWMYQFGKRTVSFGSISTPTSMKFVY